MSAMPGRLRFTLGRLSLVRRPHTADLDNEGLQDQVELMVRGYIDKPDSYKNFMRLVGALKKSAICGRPIKVLTSEEGAVSTHERRALPE